MQSKDQEVDKEFLLYQKRKLSDRLRYERFVKNRKESGLNEIKYLWVRLDFEDSKKLKEHLKNASTDELKCIIMLFDQQADSSNDLFPNISEKLLLRSELLNYIDTKDRYRKEKESLSELSLRLMNKGIMNFNKRINKKVPFTPSSLSRLIRKLKEKEDLQL